MLIKLYLQVLISFFCPADFPMMPGGVSGAGLMQPAKSNASGSSVTAKSQPDSGTAAGGGGGGVPAHSQASGGASHMTPSQPPTADPLIPEQLNVSMEMAIVVRAMQQADSGLEIQDRTWLKITIPNAVIGEWLVKLRLSTHTHCRYPVFDQHPILIKRFFA